MNSGNWFTIQHAQSTRFGDPVAGNNLKSSFWRGAQQTIMTSQTGNYQHRHLVKGNALSRRNFQELGELLLGDLHIDRSLIFFAAIFRPFHRPHYLEGAGRGSFSGNYGRNIYRDGSRQGHNTVNLDDRSGKNPASRPSYRGINCFRHSFDGELRVTNNGATCGSRQG